MPVSQAVYAWCPTTQDAILQRCKFFCGPFSTGFSSGLWAIQCLLVMEKVIKTASQTSYFRYGSNGRNEIDCMFFFTLPQKLQPLFCSQQVPAKAMSRFRAFQGNMFCGSQLKEVEITIHCATLL